MFRAWIFALALTLPAAAQATPLPRQGRFVFSGLCTEPGSGRMIGSRLTVEQGDRGDRVYYEWSDVFEPGKILMPYPGMKPQPPARFGKVIGPGLKGAAAETVRIEPTGRMVANFDPLDTQSARTVAGTLSEQGFALSGYEANIWLPRQHGRGVKIPVCDFRPPEMPAPKIPPRRREHSRSNYLPEPALEPPNLPKR